MRALGFVFAVGCGFGALLATSCSDKPQSAPAAAGFGNSSAGRDGDVAGAGAADGHSGGAGGEGPSHADGGAEVIAGGAAGQDSASAGAPEDGGAGGANPEQESSRQWATWPMPNPASAGFPTRRTTKSRPTIRSCRIGSRA